MFGWGATKAVFTVFAASLPPVFIGAFSAPPVEPSLLTFQLTIFSCFPFAFCLLLLGTSRLAYAHLGLVVSETPPSSRSVRNLSPDIYVLHHWSTVRSTWNTTQFSPSLPHDWFLSADPCAVPIDLSPRSCCHQNPKLKVHSDFPNLADLFVC